MADKFDIIIVGAGLIGASLVVALQRQGLKIAVLENHLPDFNNKPSGFRPISLAYGSVEILRTLKVWDALHEKATKISAVHVTEEGVLGGIHFNAKEQNVEALGYVVPFYDLHKKLYQTAADQQGVSIISINEIININTSSICVAVGDKQKELTADLVVGCDGAHSTVREILGVSTQKKKSEEVAVTALLNVSDEYKDIALERLTADGVLAILPLKNKKQCGLVWTMTKTMSEKMHKWEDLVWIKAIQTSFFGRLPKIKSIKKGAEFPLQTIIAKPQFVSGAILLGNAAHTIYPLAAQGFNLGLRDAASLAEVLVLSRKNKESLGDEKVLQRYFEWREQDQKKIIRLTSSVNKLFSTKKIPSSFRGLAMLMMDLMTPLKDRMAKMTMGLSGKLPKLARGLRLWE